MMLALMSPASAAPGEAPPSTSAFLCLLAGGCAIAFAPILVRISDTGPVASAFWRCALAVPLLWLWVYNLPSPWPSGDRAHPASTRDLSPGEGKASPSPLGEGRGEGRFHMRALIAAGLFFAADLGVWHWSIIYTSVANSTLLANLAPIFVTLAGWLFWRQRVTRTFLVGMVVAIAGMFVLVGLNFAVGGTRLLGDALGALTGVFYAGYMLAIKSARDADASTAHLMAWSTTITAIALAPVALLSPQPFLPATDVGWWVLLGLAVISQIVGQGLIAYAFAHLPASLSSVSLLIQPVMASIFAWWLFAEAIGAVQFVGGAIVLAGIWLARKGS